MVASSLALAQEASTTVPSDEKSWDVQFQSMVVGQGHPSFPAAYTGSNSLTTGAAVRETVSLDMDGAARDCGTGENFSGTSSCGRDMA